MTDSLNAGTPVAVVTGAGRGIGRAIAVAFGRSGYDVVVTARTLTQLEETQRRVQAVGRRCAIIAADLAEPDAPRRVVVAAESALRRVDVLVNNAGTGRIAAAEDFSQQEFDRTMALNVRAPFLLSQAVWPIMKRLGGGTIINISSVAARDPFPRFTVYAATKAALNLLTVGLADEGKEHGIRVFGIGPGPVDTELLRSAVPDIPADQCLTPDDIADLALLLVDPRGRYATGQTLYVTR